MLLKAGIILAVSRIWHWLDGLDQSLFLRINTVWTHTFLDKIFPLLRESNMWMPLYLFLLVFAIMNLGKKSWVWILFLVITVAVCDQVSSTFIKNWFNRVRPCHNDALVSYMRLLVVYCPRSGSFTSSHAVNHFGIAAFVAVSLQSLLGKWRFAFYAWAAVICYAQVYVGVHYPLDVIGGGALGSLIGFVAAKFYQRKFENLNT